MVKFAISSLLFIAAGFMWSGCASDQSHESGGSALEAGVMASGGGGGVAAGGAGGTVTGTGGVVTGTGGVVTGTGGVSGGSCNPMFCAEDGFGTACCVTPNGPCGLDMGNGVCTTMNPGLDGG